MSHEPAPYTTPPPVASPVAPEAAEFARAINGYAPGPYFGRCCHCKQEFLGDKRAVSCPKCAYEAAFAFLTAEAAALRTQLAEAEEARKAEVAGLTAKLAREGEQEAELLKRDERLRQLRSAIEKASAPHLSAEEREAYASNTNGQGTRGAFGAGQLMGRVALAQDLLALLAPKLPAAGIQEKGGAAA